MKTNDNKAIGRKTDVRVGAVSDVLKKKTKRKSAAGAAGQATEFEEIELKIVGKPAALKTLFENFTGKAQRSAKVLSTYYDTSDNRLWERGYTLRLRKKGTGYELTMKSRSNNALSRGEWTSHIQDARADIGLLPNAAPRRETGVILAEELHPKFTTEIVRGKKIVPADGATIEVCLDSGRVFNDSKEEAISELEFELIDGSTEALLAHVRENLGRSRFSVNSRTKSDRGFDLANNSGPAFHKAAKPILDSSDTITTALAKILAVTVSQIIGNIPAASDGQDPEGVHQLRVGLRRLRSALSVFKNHLSPDALAIGPRAKEALSRLGPARDLDVFLLETIPPVRKANDTIEGLDHLTKLAEDRRRAAYTEVRRLVSDGKFNRLLLELLSYAQDCSSLISTGAHDRLEPIAVKLLKKRHKHVLKLGKNFSNLDVESRHDVRIGLKKLRYACDYFQGLFPDKTTLPYLKKLASLQDDLGHLNDVSVAELLISDLCDGQPDAAVGGAVAKGWYTHRLKSIEPHMIQAWSNFSEAKPFWQT